MSITHDFATAPGHAHLNLLGWVSLSIIGLYYATLGRETPAWMVSVNFVLNNIGVICLSSGLGLVLSQTLAPAQVMPLFLIGEFATIFGFLTFAAAVLMGLRRSGRASRTGPLAVA